MTLVATNDEEPSMIDSTPLINIPAATVLHRISPDHLAIPEDLPEAAKTVLTQLHRWDTDTMEHCLRVGKMCEDFGRWLNLDQDELALLRLAAYVHDAGKLRVGTDILTKDGRLTDSEYDTVKKHAEWGEVILRRAGFDQNVLAVVRGHHERWDGHGYPDGLSATDIPRAARIIALVDTLDAMSAKRSYHRRRTNFLALAEIRRCSGTQFDPELATTFIDFVCQQLSSDRRVA